MDKPKNLIKEIEILDVKIDSEINGAYASVWITVTLNNKTLKAQNVCAAIVLKKDDAQERIEINEVVDTDICMIEGVIRIEEPELWYPSGYGEQPLYECLVGIHAEEEIQDVSSAMFGVFEMQLIHPEGNTSFAKSLLVNHRLVFANGIKIQKKIEGKQNAEKLIKLLKNANCNTLIVESKPDPELKKVCLKSGIVLLTNRMYNPETIKENFSEKILSNRFNKWQNSSAIIESGKFITDDFDYGEEYFSIKHLFEPIKLQFEESNNKLLLNLISEGNIASDMAILEIGIYKFGSKDIDVNTFEIKIKPDSIEAIWESDDIKSLFDSPHTQCLAAYLSSENFLSKTVYFACPANEIDLPAPKLYIERGQIDESESKIIVSADDYAHCVQIANLPKNSYLSDNYFFMFPGEAKEITIENISEKQSKSIIFNVAGTST